MGSLLRKEKMHFESRPRAGHILTWLLCLDPDPLQGFVSGVLIILQSQKWLSCF